MAETDNTLEIRTMIANADLSAQQFNIMRDIGNGRIVVASHAANFAVAGVLMNKPDAAGKHASVAYRGAGKVRIGAAVATMQVMLTTNGSGRAIVAASGDMVFAKSRETGANDGEIISVELIEPFRLSGPAV